MATPLLNWLKCAPWACPMVIALNIVTQSAIVEAQGLSLHDVLVAYDQEFLSGYTVEIKCTYPTFDSPRMGKSIGAVTITGNGVEHYLSLNRVQMDPLVYLSDFRTARYDEEGNCELFPNSAQYVSLTDTAWSFRTDVEKVIIDPANDLISASTAGLPVIQIYPVRHPDPANLLFRHILALGRGYSQLIDHFTDVQSTDGNVVLAKGPGRLFSTDTGTWKVSIETDKGYLIQNATFIPDGSGSKFSWTAQSYWDADVPVYREGAFDWTDYSVSVSLVNYNRKYDPATAALVQDRVSRSNEATILDFSVIDSENMPLVVSPGDHR